MNKYLLIFMLSNICFSECLKNCYLGEKFYSAPLDEKGCCQYKWSVNCEQFIEVSPDKYVCDRCKIGYRWMNNKCRLYKNKRCINPEMNLIPFDQCKVCRFNDSIKYIPIYDAQTEKYKCKKYNEDNLERFAKFRLKNCQASSAIGSSVFCYDCKKNYFMDWKTQSCIKQDIEVNYEGCKISTATNKCTVCYPEYQLDVFQEKCVSRNQEIDWEQAKSIQNPQIQKILANFNRTDEGSNIKEFIYQNPVIKEQMDNIKKIEGVLNGLKDYIDDKSIGTPKK